MSDFLDPVLLPALLIVLPILMAAVGIALGLVIDRAGWTVAAITHVGLFAGAVSLALTVFGTGERVVHPLGGFSGPQGIELVADQFSVLIALLVTATALGVLAYTRRGGPRGTTFYSGYLLLTGGLLGLTFTGDAFNMFVFLEITGLATYALVARGDGPEAAVAALKYLVIGTVGASLYLIGVGLLFMATGTLNFDHLATTIPQTVGYEDPLVQAAFAFVFVGFAIKVAQWPVHSWQPDAYQHAPDGVTPLIAALVSTVSAYAMGRVLFGGFTVDFLYANPAATDVVVLVGSISVVAGSVLAVMQPNVKRMLAYSSVSQFGLIVAAYGLLNETALIGAIVHLLGHGLMKAGLFLGVGVVAVGYGARRVDEYAGLASDRPVVAAAMAVLCIALVGIPPSIGFIGKWYIALGAVEAQVWPVAAVIFFSTMLTLLYVARLLERMYFTPADAIRSTSAPSSVAVADGGEPVDGSGAVSPGMLGMVVLIATLAVGLGFAGGPLFELLEPFASEVIS